MTGSVYLRLWPLHPRQSYGKPPKAPIDFRGKLPTIEQNQIAFSLMVHGIT